MTYIMTCPLQKTCGWQLSVLITKMDGDSKNRRRTNLLVMGKLSGSSRSFWTVGKEKKHMRHIAENVKKKEYNIPLRTLHVYQIRKVLGPNYCRTNCHFMHLLKLVAYRTNNSSHHTALEVHQLLWALVEDAYF